MGLFIKLWFVLFISACAITISKWVVDTLGNQAAAEVAIKAWSALTAFVVIVFTYCMTKDDAYEWFYNRPEQYETRLQAGSTGLTLYAFILIGIGVVIYLNLSEGGLKRRNDELRCRRREERRRRRNGQS